MSLLHYEKEEVQAWADYSGDYNPIHFDEELAKTAIGLGGVVMHGMLAMMPVKSCHSAMPWADDGWIQWKAMLRQAMPLQVDYRLESQAIEPMREISFKLSSAEDAKVKINGQCMAIDFDSSSYADCQRVSLPVEEARRDLEKFAALFPTASAAWIAIDAMIFSLYIRHHADEVFREAAAHYPDAENIVTMQTHHHDIFRRPLLQSRDFKDLKSFEYNYYITNEIFSKEMVFLMIEIPVWINGNLMQVVQIGLMARLLSPAKTEGVLHD